MRVSFLFVKQKLFDQKCDEMVFFLYCAVYNGFFGGFLKFFLLRTFNQKKVLGFLREDLEK